MKVIYKMRILHIIGKRPKGGIGTVVKNYQKKLLDYNIQFDYLIFDDDSSGDFDEQVKTLGSKVYVLPELKQKRIFILRNLIKKFFKAHQNEYSIIELHSPNIAFLIHKYAKKYGIKNRITHSHSIKLSNNKIKAIRNRILCFSINSLTTDYFACSNDAGIALFGEKIILNEKFHIINNSINIDSFKFDEQNRKMCRHNNDIKDDELCLVHVGRFSKEKNHEFLITLCKKLIDINIKFKMIFVGNGDLFEKIKDSVHSDKLEEKIIFTGYTTSVKDYLDASDLFLLPSFIEGVPLSIVEAQANGLPCLINENLPQVITTNTCYYIPLDINEWVKIISLQKITLINRNNSIQNLKNLGFDISIEAKKLSKIYKKMNE